MRCAHNHWAACRMPPQVHMVHDTSKLDPLVAEYEKRKQALTGAPSAAVLAHARRPDHVPSMQLA